MKKEISCNVKQGTALVKNSSQTVKIKDKRNEKNPYLEQNISNHKLDGSDKNVKVCPWCGVAYFVFSSYVAA